MSNSDPTTTWPDAGGRELSPSNAECVLVVLPEGLTFAGGVLVGVAKTWDTSFLPDE
jgi:hypothetical protein